MSFTGDWIPPLINVINTCANVFWSMKLKALQGNKEIMEGMRDENNQLKKTISQMQHRKNEYKVQYLQQYARNKELEGKLQVYEKLHNSK